MTRFIELRARLWDGPTSDLGVLQDRIRYEHKYASMNFPVVAKEAGLHLWSPGDSISDAPVRLLIGIFCTT